MREHGTISRTPAFGVLLGLLLALSLSAFSCGGGENLDVTHRLVLVVDPTVLRDVDTVEFNRKLGDRLRGALADLPEDTYLDVYIVGLGQTGLPADFHAFLIFDENESSDAGHRARADSVADAVAKLVQARWDASNEQPNDPSSCILTALYRAEEMTKLGAKRNQQVDLVVVSDFLEACTDTGYNFERTIPDSIGALPMNADLSGADRVLLLRMQTRGAVAPGDDRRLKGLWMDVLNRWHADTAAVEFTPTFPDTLVGSLRG